MADEIEPKGMFSVVDALDAVIKAAPKAERDALAAVMESYANEFPDEFFWAVGPQSPALLFHLMVTMDIAADDHGDDADKRGRLLRLVTRKSEGSA